MVSYHPSLARIMLLGCRGKKFTVKLIHLCKKLGKLSLWPKVMQRDLDSNPLDIYLTSTKDK